MKILITGGAGFIGSHLAEKLIAEKHHVVIVDNLETSGMGNLGHLEGSSLFEFIEGSLTNFPDTQLDKLVESCDLIYHLAGTVGVKLVDEKPFHTIDNNLQLAMTLFPLIKKHNVKTVFTSTSEVYGDRDGKMDEEMDLQIGSPDKLRWGYACSKLMQEFMLKSHQASHVIVRLFNVTGPRQNNMVLPVFVEKALKGEELQIHGDGLQTRCFCHIKDCIQSLYLLGIKDNCNNHVFNIGTEHEVSMMTLAEEVNYLCGSKSDIRKIPYEEVFSKQHKDILHRSPCTHKLVSFTGYKPKHTLTEIIEDTRDYLLQK